MTAERSTLNQNIQIGMETVPGTAVAATKRLQSVSIEPSPTVEMEQFRPIGSKFNALSTLSKEWVTAALTGKGTYTELQYILASVFGNKSVDAGSPDTGTNTWTFSPLNRSADTVQTYTVEHGSAVRADKFAYGLITEFGMTFSRDSVDLTGSMMGQALTDAITMTPSGVTANNLVPILPTEVSVYLDTTGAGLGTTKMTRMLSVEFSLGARFGPVWVLDAANPSYVNHVETAPDLSATLTLEADSQGMALLDNMREGDTAFMRIECIGNDIGATADPYTFMLDMALKVSDTGGFSDADGVYAVEFSGVGVYDETWENAVLATLVNELAAL